MQNAQVLSPAILHMCNKFLSEGKFISILFITSVSRIYRAGELKNLRNYRPIAILPSFNKILEKVVEIQLQEYLISHDFLEPSPF